MTPCPMCSTVHQETRMLPLRRAKYELITYIVACWRTDNAVVCILLNSFRRTTCKPTTIPMKSNCIGSVASSFRKMWRKCFPPFWTTSTRWMMKHQILLRVTTSYSYTFSPKYYRSHAYVATLKSSTRKTCRSRIVTATTLRHIP